MRKGFALIVAVTMGMLLTGLAIMLFQSTNLEMMIAGNKRRHNQAAMAAQSGMNHFAAMRFEYDYLKDETDLEVGVLDTKFNALGNVICANDKGAVVSPWLSKQDCQTISDVLGVEVIQKKIAGFNQTGVVLVANATGAAIHPEADEEDMKTIANVLGTNIEQSSINNGIPYVSSGILVNNHCVVVGSLTSGPEIMMLTRAFLN